MSRRSFGVRKLSAKMGFFSLVIFIASVLVYISLPPYFKISDQNLRKFYDLTRSDPLFYDPNTDLELLSSTTQRLKEKDDQIIEINNKYQKNQAEINQGVFPKDWRLWPDGFLTLLPTIHEETESFLKEEEHPDRNNALSLLDRYEEAAAQYKKAIDSNISVMKVILERTPKLKTTKILFLGSATTPEIVLNDFLLIRLNAEELSLEIKQRKSCLFIGFCPAKKDNPVFNTGVDNSEIVQFQPLDEEVLTGNKDSQALAGPYRASTGCFGYTKDGKRFNYPFFVKVDTNTEGNRFLKPMLSNTKYYKDFRKIPKEPVSQMYLKRGVKVKPHPEVNDYLCSDLRYIPDLIIQYLLENGLADESSVKAKLSTLPYLIEHTISFSDIPINYPMFSKKPTPPLSLLIDRSAYSLYFGTFSPAIWRMSESPVFLIHENFSPLLNRAGYVKYQDLVAEGMSLQDIKQLNFAPGFNDVLLEAIGNQKKP